MTIVEENEALKARLEAAKKIYSEQKREIATCKSRVVGQQYRSLQPTRDRLWGLAYELKNTTSADEVFCKTAYAVIIEIIANLKESGLWEESDDNGLQEGGN